MLGGFHRIGQARHAYEGSAGSGVDPARPTNARSTVRGGTPRRRGLDARGCPCAARDCLPRRVELDCRRQTASLLSAPLTFCPSLFSSGTYIDKKCPFTGNVSIRGRILTGVVKSTKMKRTIIIRMNYLHYIRKYQRYEKRHTNIAAHISPCFRCQEGDTVVVGQCRPLSKTVRFNTLKVIPSGSKAGKSFVAN